MFLHLGSRCIVDWATNRSHVANLALAALNQAIALRQPAACLIVHDDRCSPSSSSDFRPRLAVVHFWQSMSSKGNCDDNAPIEGFFKSFQVEEPNYQDCETHEQANRTVVDYFDRLYNPQRLHSSIDCISRVEFEGQLLLENKYCVRNQPSAKPLGTHAQFWSGRSPPPQRPTTVTEKQISTFNLPWLMNSE